MSAWKPLLLVLSTSALLLTAAADLHANPKDKAEAKKTKADKNPQAESDKSEEEQAPAKVGVLQLTLKGAYADLPLPSQLSLLGGITSKQKSFYRLCDYIDELAGRDDLAHVVLDFSPGSLSLNRVQAVELCRHIAALRASGKHTIAWLDGADSIYLTVASACDEVVMSDMGLIDFPSASMSQMYMKDLFNLLGVEMSYVRAGDFKGAVEPLTRSSMSSHLRAHYTEMLTSLNNSTIDQIAKGRKLTPKKVREIQRQRLVTPKQALELGLVDKLADYGTLRATIATGIGGEIEWSTPEKKKAEEMGFFELVGAIMSEAKPDTIRKPAVVVLHLSGAIVDGEEASAGSIVSGPTVKEINELRDNNQVKGVVVRINSPGGSGTASEAVRQALASLAEKKPVVISMGSMAASGGYWITCIDARVYAERETVTGSIGAFALMPNISALLSRVGINVESVTLDDAAASFSMDQPLSDEDKEKLQGFLDEMYGKFLNLVADSRSLRLETVKEIAGGRVWTGAQAKKLGLVDQLGGLEDCLDVIRKRAGDEKLVVEHRPKVKQGIDLSQLFGEDDEEIRIQAAMKNVQRLKQLGYDLSSVELLLRSLKRPNASAPTIWLLPASQLQIR